MPRKFSCLAIALFVVCFISPAHADDDKFEEEKNRMKVFEFIFDGASKDIADNISLFVALTKRIDAASGLAWRIALGDKIPSQPVAVIEVLSRVDEDLLPQVCPRIFMEGSEDYAMVDWMNRAIQSLGSFTMQDSRKDAIRAECLERIEASLKMLSHK
jgi:hypothetical protein